MTLRTALSDAWELAPRHTAPSANCLCLPLETRAGVHVLSLALNSLRQRSGGVAAAVWCDSVSHPGNTLRLVRVVQCGRGPSARAARWV